ncbi:4-(cytidine 5'-diphospho)-2-C-methyl-D-erythritol kinase [soil metagenome]
MQPFTLPSFAKVNLTLRILGKRDDGYHELFTVFQTVSLYDRLTFRPSEDLSMTCNHPYVPTDGRNLVMKAAEAMRERFGVKQGARVHLDKHIPTPGGLGGGSSDAAVALIGLKKLWRIDCKDRDLHGVATELGSDVPFFLTGGTAIGVGRGEAIEPLTDIGSQKLLIVTPKVRVSTRSAFARINAPTLTNEDLERILRVCRVEADSLDLRQTALINDFEASVFAAYPEVERVKQTLLKLGAVNAAMSGSGASVFAIFDKTETRQAAQKALDHESTWRKFAVATISRSEYRDALGL